MGRDYMASWPKMISTKDLSYIEDMFKWNDTTLKKVAHYLEMCEDENLCNLLENTRDIVENNACKLIKLLESGVK